MQTQSAVSTKQTDRRALSPLKHGLTGRIYLLSQAEQMAYDELSRGLHQDLTPAGEMEMQLVQALVDDRWRLGRANCLEMSLFADGAERFADSPEATGDADVDLALSEGRVWQAEAKNLNLLSLSMNRGFIPLREELRHTAQAPGRSQGRAGASHSRGRASLPTRRKQWRTLQSGRALRTPQFCFFSR